MGAMPGDPNEGSLSKAAQDMGLKPVSHLEGGFAAWKKSGNPIETKE